MTEATHAAAQRVIDEHGFLSWLDVSLADIGEGRAVLTVPDAPKLRNVPVSGESHPVHGGVVAALADTVSAFAIRSTLAEPFEASVTTTNLDVSYLRPAVGDLRAIGEVVRAGRSMGVIDVSVTAAGRAQESSGADSTDRAASADDAREVAVARATYRIFEEDR